MLCSRFGAVTAPTVEHTRQLVRRSLHRKPATQHAPGSRHTSGHQLLLADRTVTAAVTEVLAANPDATLFDIEMAFRDVGARAYGIAGPEPTIVLGMRAWRAALGRAGVSPEENRAALAGTTSKPIGRRAS